MFFMDTTINHSYATATNAVAGRWDALTPELKTLAKDDYPEFFATAPADTVVLHSNDIYRRKTLGGWEQLGEIEQAWQEDDDAVLTSFHHSDLCDQLQRSAESFPVQILVVGKRALWL